MTNISNAYKACIHLPKGTKLIKVIQHDSGCEFIVEDEHISRICPKCGSDDCVVKSSSYTQTIRTVRSNKKAGFITTAKPRFVCKSCGKSFYHTPDWVSKKIPTITEELYMSILFDLTERFSMTDISKIELVPPHIVRKVLDCIDIGKPSSLPETLCIDEFKGDAGEYESTSRHWRISDKYQCNITNGDSGKAIDILPDRKAANLIKYFSTYSKSEKSKVKFVCCDMHGGFLTTSRKCFPNAVVCVDMFHVIQELNRVVDTVRRRLQDECSDSGENDKYRSLKYLSRILLTKQSNQDKYWKNDKVKKLERLRTALDLFPELNEAYNALQGFHMLCSVDIISRKSNLTDWINAYTNCNIPELATAAGTIRKWRPYIENSWKYNKSNAACEGVNNAIKALKRQSFGVHDFELFRKRILLICGSMHLSYDCAFVNPNRAQRCRKGDAAE